MQHIICHFMYVVFTHYFTMAVCLAQPIKIMLSFHNFVMIILLTRKA